MGQAYEVLDAVLRRLERALEEGRTVRTPCGKGVTRLRRLADLVLPTGKILLGYPGSAYINDPSVVRPQVSPGRYAVWMSVADHPEVEVTDFAAVVVQISPAPVRRWRSAGTFFTDSGNGCIVDVSLIDDLRVKGAELSVAQCRARKLGPLQGGDGSLLIDPASGGNAIIWKTADWSYDCFTGLDRDGRIARVVVDGRWPRWPWETIGGPRRPPNSCYIIERQGI